MTRSFVEPLKPEGLIRFKFYTKSHIESRSVVVAGSRPRGGPVRRSRGCAKKGYAGGVVGESPTHSPRRL